MALKTQQGIIFYSPDILNGEKFQGLIKDIKPDYLTITIPIGNIAVNQGIDVFVNFWDEQATYEFKSKSLNSKTGTEDILKIAKPTTLTKLINRSHPRIVVNIEGTIHDYYGLKSTKCLIVDISGGGVLVTAWSGRKANSMVKLVFTLPNGEKIEELSGKICWAKSIDNSLSNYGIEFQNISEIRRKKIITFCIA